MTSMRRNDVASTSFQRHVPTRFLINKCQIITFLVLKSDIINNSRIELKGTVFASTFKIKYKLHLLIFLPVNLVHLLFFLFHIEIEGKGGWIIGGQKGMLAPSQTIIGGGGGAAPPCPPPHPHPPPPPTPPPLFLRLWNCRVTALDK